MDTFVLKVAEMRELDRWTSKEFGLPSRLLMENAGRTVYQVALNFIDKGEKTVVIAGKGNNGGDGFVAARYLLNNGYDVEAVLVGDEKDLKGNSLINHNLFASSGGIVHQINDINDESIEILIESADLLIDALFGTGFKGKPEGIYRDIIELANESNARIISVDIPSGIEGDSGQVNGACIVSDATVTMGALKRGLVLYPGKALCGDVYIADIGFPQNVPFQFDTKMLKKEDLRIPFRIGNEHKGKNGKVLIIAGSRGFTGAASLASLAAAKSGAGLVYLAIPEDLNDICEVKLTEVITIPYKEEQELFSKIQEISPDVIAIGPGLGREERTVSITKKVLNLDIPLIIDADAIFALSKINSPINRDDVVITPHPGEASFLTKKNAQHIDKQRIDVACEISSNIGVNVVLKGAPTIIKIKNGLTFINDTGNSGLAKGGSGDVLTGFMAGFSAQMHNVKEAALLAVYLHGKIADELLEEKTVFDMMPSDIIDNIGKVLKKML